VHQVIKRLQHRLRHHALVVEPFPIGTEVFMDVMMTEQVLSNVLDNACKYTPAGTRIEISFKADEKGFLLRVHDYGKGLPADKLSHVFDKYARLKKEDTQVAGTGLGLSICKAIMEAQGGSITASNHPEGGAVFTLFLPKWRQLAATKAKTKNVA
jgi:two-component system, OmpR family, sensor histidine kinase KdpD